VHPSPEPIAARRLSAALFAAWLAVIAASLAVVAVELGPTALAGASAHESESRSLLGVALYPAHALRELPHASLLALVWLAATAPARDARDLVRQIGRLALVAALVGLALFVAAAREVGALAAWQDLAQFRAARGLEGAGSHFRFHLLSDVALAGLFYVVGRTVRRDDVAPPAAPYTPAVAAVLFVAALASWGVADVLSPRFVGHAGREVETAALIVLPPLCALALRAPGASFDLHGARRELGVWLAAGATAVATGILLIRSLGVDLMAASSAPSRGVALNLAVHHFEHLFDAAFVVLIDRLEARRRARPDADRPSAPD
jgi:hypothetical protein